jgi:hypothetical protein
LFLIANCNLEMITIGRYSTHQPNFTAMVDPATFGAEAGFFRLKYGRFKGEKSEHGRFASSRYRLQGQYREVFHVIG